MKAFFTGDWKSGEAGCDNERGIERIMPLRKQRSRALKKKKLGKLSVSLQAQQLMGSSRDSESN
jgi:hypothetical protein